MQLVDLKKSILQLPREEVERIHREVRKNRIDFKKPTEKRQKKQGVRRVTKAAQEVRKDPEKIRALLRLLGEDV